MISIRDLIATSNSNVRAQAEIERDRRVRAVYDKYPDLEQIDNDIVSARTTRFIAVIDNNEVEIKHSTNLEKQLLDKRNRFMARNDIPDTFDEERVVCSRCNDTGFFTNKSGMKQVCPCRADDIEESYRLSGIGDFSTIKIESYKDDHFGNKSQRLAIRRSLLECIMGKKTGNNPLMIYSDGIQTGKTFLSIYALKLAINLGYSVYYLRLDDLSDMDEEDIDDLKDVDILVIDNYIAGMTMTGSIGTKLSSILETRQAREKSTVIVTSFPVKTLIDDSDARVSGKIKKAFVIGGKSSK